MKTNFGVLLATALIAFPTTAAMANSSGLVGEAGNLPGILTNDRVRTQTATKNGITFTASNRIVGVGSTGTIGPPPAGQGSTAYLATAQKYSGTVALIMNYGPGQNFICSGSLMADRMSILTAAHCVTNGPTLAQPLTTTAYFYGGPNDQFYNVTTGPDPVTVVGVSKVFVNEDYTGQVVDQNDIAVLRLTTAAPAFAQHYLIDTSASLVGADFNVAGYGGRGAGGNTGQTFGTGRRRQGDNRYDYEFGDSAFGGFFTDLEPNGFAFWDDPDSGFAAAEYSRSLVSDFDNGLQANDMSCNVGVGAFGGSVAQFCDLGRGFTEVSVAGGDSGGPQFVNGKVASVTSYGFSFGANFGDVLPGLNSSFGEGNGFVSTALHRNFILSSMVPEPGSWALMIAGFGLVGASMRRQRGVAATA